jgi:hypothetical protein
MLSYSIDSLGRWPSARSAKQLAEERPELEAVTGGARTNRPLPTRSITKSSSRLLS